MKSGFQATRRSRNIGTAKQGHGSANKLTIPSSHKEDRIWWEAMRNPIVHDRVIANRTVKFIVDEVREGCIHPCSIDDVVTLLGLLPGDDWLGIDTFVFRQSTRKQHLLEPSWGRLAIAANPGKMNRSDLSMGPTIFLEAIDISVSLKWSNSLDPSSELELNRLKDDGHFVQRDRRGYKIQSTRESARTTQLYRTIPHEIGHWVDWVNRVEKPCGSGQDFDLDRYEVLSDAYWARPSQERESFAHSYADRIRAVLIGAGITL